MANIERRERDNRDFQIRNEWEYVTRADEYEPQSDLERRAYDFILEKHKGQERKDGSPYVNHLTSVASIIRDVMKVDDEQVLAAALLHDVVEDTKVTLQELRDSFGSDVANLVSGVTELKSGGRTKKEQDVETTRKVVRASGLDVRVALIKLADRCHNMMTLGPISPEKRVAKSKETFEVYAPLAESLGVWEIKRKLEDLAVFHLYPEKMAQAKVQIDNDPRLTRDFLYHWKTRAERMMDEGGIVAEVEWQVMGYWEAVKKKEELGVEDFSQVQLVSMRVKVADEMDCRMASMLTRMYETEIVDVARADDYITQKSYNGYEAIHDGLVTKEGALELAFVTHEMEDFNTWGVVGEMRRDGDVGRYNLKLIFDRDGKVMQFLPAGATGVDLVVSIDPGLLGMVSSLVVNGDRVPLSVNIPNAAMVGIELDANNGFDPQLMDYALLPKTREKLTEMLAVQRRKHEVAMGKSSLSEWMNGKGFDDLSDLLWGEIEKREMRYTLLHLGVKSVEELYLEIGLGNRVVEEVIRVMEGSRLSGLNNKLMKIRLEGEDAPGIMQSVSDMVTKRGGLIRLSHAESDGDRYSFELVVTGIAGDDKIGIREELVSIGGDRYAKVMVV